MRIFECLDYKKFVESKIKEMWKIHGYKSRLAGAAGCQLSYLSQVLKGSAHLTPDHALKLALFWRLGSFERDYFLELVNLARAGSSELRAHVRERLERIKSESENLGRRFDSRGLASEDATSVYYSSWHYSAIHILLTIPEYRTVPAISMRLRLPEPLVLKALQSLERFGLARVDGTRWEATQKAVHLPIGSAWNALNHSHWRQKAVENAFSGNVGDLHYTAVYSLSFGDLERLKNLLLQFIDESRKIVALSPEQELVCFNCDFFKILG